MRGRHGKGAALYAKRNFGAVEGVGTGLQGTQQHKRSYAIPTKSWDIEPLSLNAISLYIEAFCIFAEQTQDTYHFIITPVGCGLAGYSEHEILPHFQRVAGADYVTFADSWKTCDNKGNPRKALT